MDMIRKQHQADLHRMGLVFGLLAGLAYGLAVWGWNALQLWQAAAEPAWLMAGVSILLVTGVGGLVGWLCARIDNAFVAFLAWVTVGVLFSWLAMQTNYHLINRVVELLYPEFGGLHVYPLESFIRLFRGVMFVIIGFASGLAVGASVAVDGVCLTVTALDGDDAARFDVMQQSLSLTTLAAVRPGSRVNVERAARDGAEIGGHPLSGHIDFMGRVAQVRLPENNRVLRIEVPAPWMRYVFAKGYIAVNGASLTVSEAQREAGGAGWFEVWLIPETLRATTFADKAEGAALNIEIERQTQVFVDTVRDAIDERLGPLRQAVETLLRQQGLSLDELARPAALPPR